MRADGSLHLLEFDGGVEMSSAVHVGDGRVAVGAQAWRQAATDPDGFVLSPLRAGTGQLTAGTITVDAADLVAATLRQVATEAARAAGEPVHDAQLLVPAGAGPRHRTWLRHAARNAGLHVTRLVDVPVTAANRLAPTALLPTASDRMMLIIDVGAGCEVSVLRQSMQQTDVLATLDDQDAGGDRIDALLTHALTGTALDDLPAAQRWTTLAVLRAAQQALAQQATVTIPLPGAAGPLVVPVGHVTQVAQPVLERVGELAAETVAAADLTLADIHGVHLIGGVAAVPGAAEMIGAKLGVVPQIAAQPSIAAVAGAAESDPARATPHTPGTGQPFRLPPLRRILLLGFPALCRCCCTPTSSRAPTSSAPHRSAGTAAISTS
ncbi:Hsp70 family protein [Actinoplanes awajinensis]|nr:Hsp70 family protein [Actinoplanes awajinensis]